MVEATTNQATTNQATTNRGWRLRRNPAGALAAGDLELITDPIAPLRDGQAWSVRWCCRWRRPAGSG